MADEPTIEALQGEISSLRASLKAANDEAKGHRLNSDNFRKSAEDLRGHLTAANEKLEQTTAKHSEDIEKLRIDLNAKATAAETKAAQAQTAAKDRVMMADLKVAAREAGMVDLDGLKLLDMAQAKAEDDGTVTNAADLLTAMKTAKPYLFGDVAKPGTVTGTTTSTSRPPPVKTTQENFNARTATQDEYEAGKREMLAGVRR